MKRIMSLGVSEGSYIVVEPEWGDEKTIFVSMQSNGLGNPEYSVKLDAAKIRKLRKQLKRALMKIEGVPCEEKKAHDEADDWFSVGKTVKVTGNSSYHGFQIGEIVKITHIDSDGWAKAEYLDGHDYWWVKKSDCEPA